MYCRKCGKDLMEDSEFCPKCGTRVENDEAEIKNGTTTTMSTQKNVSVVLLLLANLAVVFMPFYKMLGRETYKNNYSFVDLSDMMELRVHKDKADLYNIFNWIVYLFICLNVILIIIAIIQLVNGKNWNNNGYKSITNKLIGVTLVNIVEIVYMFIIEMIFSENYLRPGRPFSLTVWYCIVIGVVVATFFAEVGIRNAWKKQEQ